MGTRIKEWFNKNIATAKNKGTRIKEWFNRNQTEIVLSN